MPSFRHLHTTHASDSDEGFEHGHVVWGNLGGPRPMALCWEWAEVRMGVVAIFNPMNVLSNVRLVSEDGQPFSYGQMMLALNTVVHEVDWQSLVCQDLRFRRLGGKSVIPMTPRIRRSGDSLRQSRSSRSLALAA